MERISPSGDCLPPGQCAWLYLGQVDQCRLQNDPICTASEFEGRNRKTNRTAGRSCILRSYQSGDSLCDFQFPICLLGNSPFKNHSLWTTRHAATNYPRIRFRQGSKLLFGCTILLERSTRLAGPWTPSPWERLGNLVFLEQEENRILTLRVSLATRTNSTEA